MVSDRDKELLQCRKNIDSLKEENEDLKEKNEDLKKELSVWQNAMEKLTKQFDSLA